MNQDIKRHLISAGVTFLSTFLVFISFEIQSPNFSFTRESLATLAISAVITGARAVAKIIVEWNTDKTTPVVNN